MDNITKLILDNKNLIYSIASHFKGYNSLPNQFGDITHIDVFKGTNFISNGHHRVHVLLKYGVKYINVFYV